MWEARSGKLGGVSLGQASWVWEARSGKLGGVSLGQARWVR